MALLSGMSRILGGLLGAMLDISGLREEVTCALLLSATLTRLLRMIGWTGFKRNDDLDKTNRIIFIKIFQRFLYFLYFLYDYNGGNYH